MAPEPGYEMLCGQKSLFAKNTSAGCGWLHGTADVSFGHGLLVFSSMLAPVRQSPTCIWATCRCPTVGMGLALGRAGLGSGPGVGCGCAAAGPGVTPPPTTA